MTDTERDTLLALVSERMTAAHETLRDAQLLMTHSGQMRSVVNRAYYAAFYAAGAALRLKNVVPKSHQSALQLFNWELARPTRQLPSAPPRFINSSNAGRGMITIACGMHPWRRAPKL